jgi:hypothetical protein
LHRSSRRAVAYCFAVSPAAAFYRASGLVLWRKAVVEVCVLEFPSPAGWP